LAIAGPFDECDSDCTDPGHLMKVARARIPTEIPLPRPHFRMELMAPLALIPMPTRTRFGMGPFAWLARRAVANIVCEEVRLWLGFNLCDDCDAALAAVPAFHFDV
jgi:hypothetical protein